MTTDLPIKLGKEPLLDAVFQVRFDSVGPASSLLPGLVLPLLPSPAQTAFESLPASQIPAEIRSQDENLKHAPLLRVTWGDKYAVLFGDTSLAVGCLLPYGGWNAGFKQAIIDILNSLKNASFVSKIDSYSIKYVDFFDKNKLSLSGLDRFSIGVKIGEHSVDRQNLHLRVELEDAEFLHMTTIYTNAIVQQSAQMRLHGAILDVDTHRKNVNLNVDEFLSTLPEALDRIHLKNKKFFFSCLSPQGLEELEPIYAS